MRQLVILTLLPLLSGCTINPATATPHLRASAHTANGTFEFDCWPPATLSDVQQRGEQPINTLTCPSLDGRASLSVTRQLSKAGTQNAVTSRLVSVVLKVAGDPLTYAAEVVTSSTSSNFFRPQENTTFRASLSGDGEVRGSLFSGME